MTDPLHHADLQELPRVIVVVAGGLVTDVCTDMEANVSILDRDNQEQPDPQQIAYMKELEEEVKTLPFCY